MLVKKTPFTAEEKSILSRYFRNHDTDEIYPFEKHSAFSAYAKALSEGLEDTFVDLYPSDISVVNDDRPFFFKFYRLREFNPVRVISTGFPVHGTVVFLSQAVSFFYACLFMLLFILLPLSIFKRRGLQELTRGRRIPFVLFFGCVGLGFMLIEIPMMQRFSLLLGSPLHSISISLAALLIFSGIGSPCCRVSSRRRGAGPRCCLPLRLSWRC